jgi:hypothetical protein
MARRPNDQDILAHFTRPTRPINHPAIAEIRTGTKHTAIKAAASEELDSFIASGRRQVNSSAITAQH